MSELVVDDLLVDDQEQEQEGLEVGQIWTRSAEVSAVSFPQRTIELVVIPYETPTRVAYGGRMIEEVVSRGAFGKAKRLSGMRKVNRDHDFTRPVGFVRELYPNRDDGLLAKLQISATPAGDETLVLADERVLDASAGFGLLADESGRPKPGAEVWETRSRRRLNHLWLDHVGMVANPAYGGTHVLAVRSQQPDTPAERPATPNRDAVRAAELERLYADLDARYLSPR